MPPSRPRRRPRASAVLCALALALQLAAPAALAASSTADEADVAFELGNEAYARGSFNLALQAYFTSYRLVPNRNVLFNIARCYEALERYSEAYRYYDALAAEAELLEPGDATEVRRSLERLRPQVALVRVESTPRGAEVYVGRQDADSRGRTPLVLALPPGGRQRLLVRKEGHRPAEVTVTPVRGRTLTQGVELVPVIGAVELSGAPAGAEVREGSAQGPVLGTLPGRFTLAPGRHVLHVGAPGYAGEEVVVEVPEDASVQARVALARSQGPAGRLRVTASREGARVRVDGRPVGLTPLQLTLPEGAHTVEVESHEARAGRQRVQVVREQEQALHVELRHAPPPVYAASRSLRAQDAASASTTVLSQEELRAFGYTTLAEALAGVRGLFVTDDRRYTALGVRGIGPLGDVGSRVLVLWDGHPLNDVGTARGYVGHDLSVDLDEVERIEVVRGPQSALYGSGALLAVINVVPRETLGVGEHLEVTGALGALGGARAHATTSLESAQGAAGSAAQRSLLVSAALSRSRGAEFTSLGEGRATVEGLDAERSAGGSVRARLGGLTLLGHVNARHKEVPTAPGGTTVGGAGTEVRDVRAFAEARYERTLSERLQLRLRGAYDASRHRGLWALPGGRQRSAAGADWVTGELGLGARVGSRHALTLGLETQAQLRVTQQPRRSEGSGAETAADLPMRVVLSVYALDEWTLHPRLTLSAGLRLDSVSDVDALPLSPRLALLARPYDGGRTMLGLGRGIRAPSAHELYFEDAALAQRAPASLSPEALDALELEHAHALGHGLRLTLGGHHQRLSDRVVLAPAPGGAACGTQAGCLAYANAEDTLKTWGAEAGVHWEPGRLLRVDVSYAWVHLQDASPEAEAAAPRHLASARLLLPVADGSVRLATQATYQGARGEAKGPGGGEALLLGFGVSGDYGRLRYFAGVSNLLDSAYALPAPGTGTDGIPQYRRTFTLQLTGSL